MKEQAPDYQKATRCYHFTLHGTTYEPGNVLAYNESEDLQCTSFKLGQVLAMWGNDIDSCGFLVEEMDYTLDKDFMVFKLTRRDSFEVVLPGQLCCHVPYNAMDIEEPVGLVCSLSCMPTFFGQL